MKLKFIITVSLFLFPLTIVAAQAFYCPQNHMYVQIGMTEDQVIGACGQPTFKRTSGSPVMQKIPVTQLIYTTLNQGASFAGWTQVYDMWSLPSGSVGTSVQVNIINNKISSISLNGSSTNALTVCQGANLQIGDDMGSVYSACGSPSLVNNTYINKPVPSTAKPEVWIYQIDQYQPQVNLTFVNGALQSID